MITPVVFGPVEMALVNYLTAAFTARDIDVPVVNEVPRQRPTSYVLVLRPGGAQANRVRDRATIVTETCDPWAPRAAQTAGIVRALLEAVAPGWIEGFTVGALTVDRIWIDRVTDRGLAYSPDPDTHQPRYLGTKELYVAGTALT